MLGVLITLLVAVGAIGMGSLKVGRWTSELDPAARLAVHGLTGLASLGLMTLFIGLIPGGLSWGIGLVGVYVLAGYVFLAIDIKKNPVKISRPEGLYGLFLLAFVLAIIVSLVGVLAPATMKEWDSLAYHLAIPKLYLQAGHVYPLFIHQSNFPGVVDYLYIWGLKWGGQSGAKAFTLAFLIFGMLATFGLARQRYGDKAGLWATLAFAFVPVSMWESGTAYIDLSNGVFAGLGIAFAAMLIAEPKSRQYFWLAAIFLGFAAGSKYTGLQTIFAVCLVFVAYTRTLDGLKTATLIGVLAMAVCCPWYIKNVAYTGNPVFPFFFEKLGGKNWDQRRADIYRNQQYDFGQLKAGKPGSKIEKAGAAVFGLALEPAEYIDQGQTAVLPSGGSVNVGAVGMAVLLSLFLWLVSGKATRFEGGALSTVLVSIAMWIFLSQQSRYIVPLTLPLAVLLGGGVKRLRLGPVLAGASIIQAALSLWQMEQFIVTDQVSLLTGKITAEDYQKHGLSFYEPAQVINQTVGDGKVALYDEVFGFLLDVPYMWANPGHSTEIPYDEMQTGADYAAAMKKLGFTHVYLNMRFMFGSPDDIQNFYQASGLSGQPVPLNHRDELFNNWEVKYKALISDALAHGDLEVAQAFKGGNLLLRIK